MQTVWLKCHLLVQIYISAGSLPLSYFAKQLGQVWKWQWKEESLRQNVDTGRDLLRVWVKRVCVAGGEEGAGSTAVKGSGDTVQCRRHGSPAGWSPAVHGSWGTRRRYSPRTTTNSDHRSSATGLARHLVNTSNNAFAVSTVRWSVSRSQSDTGPSRANHQPRVFPQKLPKVNRDSEAQTVSECIVYAELSGKIPKPCLHCIVHCVSEVRRLLSIRIYRHSYVVTHKRIRGVFEYEYTLSNRRTLDSLCFHFTPTFVKYHTVVSHTCTTGWVKHIFNRMKALFNLAKVLIAANCACFNV